MLYYLLSDILPFPLLGTLLNLVYFGLICSGLAVSSILIFKKLCRIGYPPQKAQLFMFLVFIISFPSGIISSRAANMFYYPFKQWSLTFFVEQFLNGNHQTFHASLILPIILISFLMTRMNFSFFESWDAIFLHIPLAHAFGRTGCLLVGCCWGNDICIKLSGIEYTVANPVPLYSIFVNLVLFLFLSNRFKKIYESSSGYKPQPGFIVVLYLLLYGLTRLFLELIRNEKTVGFGLTQAQIAMIFFIITGAVMLLRLRYKDKEQS